MGQSKQPVKLTTLIALPLLLLCTGVSNILHHCSAVHDNSQDFHSLLEFKQGITDPNGALSSWNPDTHFCRWHGVNCSSSPPYRVKEINLSGINLAGNISSSLGNLAFLRWLDLSNNSLYGPIPEALTNCSNLVYLDLSTNKLTSVIPPTIGSLTNLQAIYFDSNYLTGGIPAALGNIANLKGLGLSKNQLIGSIPHEVMQMSQLQYLSLEQNNLSGGIPEVWHMPNLEVLYLSQNNLSGRFPQDLSSVSSLQQLSLAFNMLGNALPSNIGDALPNLTTLYLGENNFVGPIPASLGNPRALSDIDLSENYLNGQIPNSLGNLSVLSILNLEGNNLQATENEGWEFIHALRKCSSLTFLSLSNNNLQGAIPSSIANLSNGLTRLLMAGNILTGIVPPGIGRLSALIELSLDHNNLTGTIQEWVGKMTKLQQLNLQSNSFMGMIPPSIGHLTQLIHFSLAENRFTGFVPPSLGNLKQMLVLNLSHNDFKAKIPIEFGNFRQLTTLDLSSNRFTGEIPETMGQFQQIYIIRLDQNILTGNVPITFKNLMSLSILNLSHNNLSGPIPVSLIDLKSLTTLDLSYNNFQGEIPENGVFDNATIVSLDDNLGLCGGVMNLHMPSCHVVYKREQMVNYMVKILVPVFGSISLVLFIYIIFHEKKMPRSQHAVFLSFGKKFPRVSYKDLEQATGSFSKSNLIGRGSYGSVYKGKLTQAKIEVAIKVFDLEIRFADKSFVSECEALRTIRHRNLVPVLTACSTIDNSGNDFKSLIYEFMPNGNLDTWLHQRHGGAAPKFLSLAQRISICVDIADALAYLHHDCGMPIVHCDIKPTNILLDDDMNAYLGDFGIANLVVDSRSIAVGHTDCSGSLTVTGTIGYIAPEYSQSVHASTCGDVYSFGIVLLEMITGKRPTDPMFEGELSIANFVQRNFPEQVLHIIDAHLLEECKGSDKAIVETENKTYICVLSLVQVSLACTLRLPRERVSMREVAINLHAIRKSYVTTTK